MSKKLIKRVKQQTEFDVVYDVPVPTKKAKVKKVKKKKVGSKYPFETMKKGGSFLYEATDKDLQAVKNRLYPAVRNFKKKKKSWKFRIGDDPAGKGARIWRTK